MQQIIIAITGPKGSGKGTVATYLARQYGGHTVTFGNVLREVCDIVNIPHDRKHLIDLAVALRRAFGEGVLGDALAARIAKLPKNAAIIIDGVRFPKDIAPWTKQKNFHLIGVDADLEVRYRRIQHRKRSGDEHRMTKKLFLKEERRPTEVHFRKLFRMCDYVIDANQDLGHVYAQADAVMKKLGLVPLHERRGRTRVT